MQLQIDNLGKVAITVEENYWSLEKDYDKLTVVEKEGTFGTYISRKPVPAGTSLTNRNYWIPFSSLKEEIVLQFNELVTAFNNLVETVTNGTTFATGEKVYETNIDRTPVENSNNLVSSGGLYIELNDIKELITALQENKANTSTVNNIVGNAPATLNSLEKVAAKLNDSDDIINSILETLSEKANNEDLAAVAKSGNYNDLNYIPNLSRFVDIYTNLLVNYYLKSEIYNKNEINSLLASVRQFTYEVDDALPTASSNTTRKLYFIPAEDSQELDKKDIYITSEDNGVYTWVKIGSGVVDFSAYYTKSEVDAFLANKATITDVNELNVRYKNTNNQIKFVNENIEVTRAGEQSSNDNKLYVSIPAGVITITLTDINCGITIIDAIFVKYKNQETTTNIGYINLNTTKSFIARNEIEYIGFYIANVPNIGKFNVQISYNQFNKIIPLQGDDEIGCSFIVKKGQYYNLTLFNKNILNYQPTNVNNYVFTLGYINSDNTLSVLYNKTYSLWNEIKDFYTLSIPEDEQEELAIIYLMVRGPIGQNLLIDFNPITIKEIDNTTELYSDNIFDINSAINGYLTRDGIVLEYNGRKLSDYIVCAGKEYFSTNFAGSQNIWHCFYDRNKTFISSVESTGKGGFAIPPNAYYLRLSMNANVHGYAAFVNSLELTDADYVPYKTVKKQVEDLTEYVGMGESGLVSIYNEDKQTAIIAAVNRNPNTYGITNRDKLFAFGIITDVHSDEIRFNRALKYLEDNDKITANFMLGDLLENSNSTNIYRNVLNYNKPTCIIPGNHEVLKLSTADITGLSDEDLMSYFYSEDLVTHNGEVHPEGKCYWYKDFSKTVDNVTKKIRVIGLYQFDSTATGEQGSGAGKDVTFYSADQIDWLVNRLAECDTNTYVMILTHWAPSNNVTRVECSFTPSASININPPGGSNTGGGHSLSDNDLLAKIVQAWIDGTTINLEWTATIGGVPNINTYSTTEPFIAHPNNFIGWFSGHGHTDYVTKLTNYPKQYQFSFACASVADENQSGDIARALTGKQQDCFTVMSYDWFNHSVNLIRIGADITIDMRERKYCNIKL